MPKLGKKFSLGYVEMITWLRGGQGRILLLASFSDDRGVPEMSDAADDGGDVAIDPKAPFTRLSLLRILPPLCTVGKSSMYYFYLQKSTLKTGSEALRDTYNYEPKNCPATSETKQVN